MNNIEKNLLDALRCAMKGECIDWMASLTQKEWYSLIKSAQIHDILPLLAQAVYQSQSFSTAENRFRDLIRTNSRQRTIYQAAATAEFELLYLFLQDRDWDPVVIKGIILRSLYPNPEQRHSFDEDLLIDAEDFGKYHRAMLDYGLTLVNPDEDIWNTFEVAYQNKGKHLYIELHKTLFQPASMAYGDLNDLFNGCRQRYLKVTVYAQEYTTLSPMDHLLYLICHAYKHFLHSVVGIRQVADIVMFSDHYMEATDWEQLFSLCQSAHIEVFTAALLQIGCQHLTLGTIPSPFSEIDVDANPLLEDILSGGLYGTADMDRTHSSNMTLQAVAAQRQGRRRRCI